MNRICIENGEIVTLEGRFEGDVLVEDGTIESVGQNIQPDQLDRRIDASGKLVLPGAIDGHVHVEWPDWDLAYGAEIGGRGAPAGGVTTFFNFVFGDPGEAWDRYEEMRSVLEDTALVDFALHAGMFTEEDIAMVPQFVEEGITSFKLLLPYKGEEVVEPAVGIDDGIVYQLMRTVADVDTEAQVIIHPENVEPSFAIKPRLREEYGEDVEDVAIWNEVRPPFLEVDAIHRLALFAEETGCPTHMVHVSSEKGVRALRRNQTERDPPLTAEAQVHYLTEDARDHDLLAKVNPPMRTAQEHDALWEGLRSGAISFLTSDHAPCATKHKENLWDATVGIPNVQTWFPLILTEVIDSGRISLSRLVEATSYNTADHYGLLPRKGGIWPGADADLLVIDTDDRTEVRAEDLHHPSDFTPFEGRELIFPEITISRGEIVVEEGEILGESGRGTFLERPIQDS